MIRPIFLVQRIDGVADDDVKGLYEHVARGMQRRQPLRQAPLHVHATRGDVFLLRQFRRQTTELLDQRRGKAVVDVRLAQLLGPPGFV